MGSCASKPKYVDYDPQMKQRKEGNEENEVKQEDDGRSSPVRRSSSRPSLGILFQKENDEQGELLTEQDERQKIPDPSANVLVSDKLENSGARAIQTVVVEDQVKPAASLAYAKEVPEESLNHETLSASLDSSSTKKAQDVGTNPEKINDQGLPTTTQAPQSAEVGDADHSENQLLTINTVTERGASSSLRNDNLDENAKNSLKPGSELPVADSEGTSDNVEDNNLGTQISTGHVDKIEKSQDPEVRPNVEDEVLNTTVENTSHVPNTTVENTSQVETEASPAVGDHISNAVKDKTFVAIDRNYVAEDESGNSLKSETLISNDVNNTSGEVEDKEARETKLTIENHDAENFQKSGSKSPVVDNISSLHEVADNKVGAAQQGTINNDRGNDAENSLRLEKEVPNVGLKHSSNDAEDADLDVTTPIKGSGQEACSRTENTDAVPVEDHHSNTNTLKTIEDDHSNSLTVNREKQISESIEASGNELDAIKPIDDFKKEPSSKTDNTDLVPVEYHHGNFVSNTEDQLLESKKASVAENVDSVVPTNTHVSSVVEESVPSGKDPGERLVTETVETGGLHRQVEEVAVSSQSDHLVTKAEAEIIDVDKNANKDSESSEKTIHSSSQVHPEELTQNKHLQNSQASSTDFAKELAENDKVPNIENVEGASVNNTHPVKDKL